ncbi:RHS repeat-associated core domain-containing protein [Pseudomonas sichuanensis]|uniref:RHS repeat-associated core domain-containing protein n=1 Tax=Pseudomonas sichuanensis TaxID=2213015 RepID=UPI002449DF34|nr:RHS repeat-associated core domain-containing protein [Pseudomonas sichuanensis]MDH0732885.1 RHS repeat-associated core domain-containing protein [Pseudomonas sichuanensis]MDH1582704.1 RHS repeat-associated core domain-containing protein [Pseudomonas sichuanensis]MDH1592580.1 RHS repeat-associated core domain-containing protein [Pseudomonas sichuanensis]MDH1598048.1 RHS repeat-associated core domain-containing protein [Pseudomonas sichuanensis]
MNDSTAQFYFYRGIQLATSINGGERISLFSGGHMPLAEVAGKDAPVNSSLYGVDSLNTIQSNRQGKPEVYTVYGFAHRSAQFSTLLGFTGQHCQLNGDYLLGRGRRVYSPTLMRFLSPDGLSPFGRGGINAYAYCEGDSVNYSDPLGTFKLWSSIKKLGTRITGYVKKEKAHKKWEGEASKRIEAELAEPQKKLAKLEAYLEENHPGTYEIWVLEEGSSRQPNLDLAEIEAKRLIVRESYKFFESDDNNSVGSRDSVQELSEPLNERIRREV